MSVITRVLVPAKQLESIQTSQYTATAVRAIIDKATLTNASVANVTVSVNLVTLAGAAAAANLMIQTRTLFPGETWNCPELVGHVLEAGGFISTLASAATSITFRVSGREVT